MKVICTRGGCEWLNGYLCRVHCRFMRVIRTQAEIQADKLAEERRKGKVRAKQARRDILDFDGGGISIDQKGISKAVSRRKPGN